MSVLQKRERGKGGVYACELKRKVVQCKPERGNQNGKRACRELRNRECACVW